VKTKLHNFSTTEHTLRVGGQLQATTSFLPIEYMCFVYLFICLPEYFLILYLFPGLVFSQLRTFHIAEIGVILNDIFVRM
jgi:hypothetical protein